MSAFYVDHLMAGYAAKPVLRDVSLEIPAGRVTAIIGANGCGKSTLLRCLARLHPADSGSVRLGEEDLTNISTADFARNVGYLPQFPLAPVGLKVNDLLALARHPHRNWMARWSAEDEAARSEALRLTELSAMAGQMLDKLSGGQRQRAWMAMLLTQSTPILLLDEPGSMLDPGHQLELIALLRALADAGRTVVVVMHDLVAARHADWLVALDGGQLAACGSPSDVLTPALLRRLYGIDSHILSAPDGTPVAVPVRPADWPLPRALPLAPVKGSVVSRTKASDSPNERRLVLTFAVLQFTLLLDYMVLMPLGAELMRDFAIGPARFGSLVGVYTLASALTSLVGSRWIDHGDRKRSLLVLYAGFIMATFSCGFAAHFDALLAARALAGACAGLSNATMMAMIADRVAPERRGQAMGTIASAFGACAVIGVPVGLSLAAVGGWRIPFFVVAALAGLWWLWLLRFLPKSPAVMTEGQGSLRSPALALGWLLSFCIVFAGFLIVPYLGTHLNGTLGVSMSQLSWIYLGAGLTTWVAAQFVGRAVDRFGAAGVLAVLLAASTVPHLWFTQLQTEPLWLISLVFVLFMVLTSTRAIPASVWLIGRVPPPLRGRYMAVNTASTEAASGLAAWCAGLMIGSGQGGAVQHFERVGWLAAGVSCLSLGLLAGLVAKTRVPTGKTSGSHPKVCNAES